MLSRRERRTASCIARGSPASEVIWPVEPLLNLLLGWPNSVVLLTLKTSQRNSRLAVSWRGNSRSSAASKTLTPGPRRVLRPLLPMTPAAGRAKASESPEDLDAHSEFLEA